MRDFSCLIIQNTHNGMCHIICHIYISLLFLHMPLSPMFYAMQPCAMPYAIFAEADAPALPKALRACACCRSARVQRACCARAARYARTPHTPRYAPAYGIRYTLAPRDFDALPPFEAPPCRYASCAMLFDAQDARRAPLRRYERRCRGYAI